MSRANSRLHLPDCQRVASGFLAKCDCKMPEHPLRGRQHLVKIKGRWRVRTRRA